MQHKKTSQKKPVKGKKDTKNTRGREKKRKEVKSVTINQMICLCVFKNLYKMEIYYNIYYKMKLFETPMTRGTVKELERPQCVNKEVDLIKYRKLRELRRLGTQKPRKTERELNCLQHDRAKVDLNNYGKSTYLYSKKSRKHNHYNQAVQTGPKHCRINLKKDIDRVWSREDALGEFGCGFLGFTYPPPIPENGWGAKMNLLKTESS